MLRAGARPFVFHTKKGSGLAGGLALPVQVGLNLARRRRLSLILAVSLPSYQVKLVSTLLALLSREERAGCAVGSRMGSLMGKAAAEALCSGSSEAVCLLNCIIPCVPPCFCRSATIAKLFAVKQCGLS